MQLLMQTHITASQMQYQVSHFFTCEMGTMLFAPLVSQLNNELLQPFEKSTFQSAVNRGNVISWCQFTSPLLHSLSSWRSLCSKFESTHFFCLLLYLPAQMKHFHQHAYHGTKKQNKNKNLEILIPGMMYNLFQVISDIIKFSDRSVI